ncbi:g4875 [Coccomyxa viridis]|uniref:Large ribosomal subunit protein uL18c n=1 Tax=Coccomyxa viridis TaxID=1274662 RepID=A0ABP1FTZ4_9CHLO
MQTGSFSLAGSAFQRGTPVLVQERCRLPTAGARESLWCQGAQTSRKERTQKRHSSLRRKIQGHPERPRLAVYRSNLHIYAQVIDDSIGNTLCATSTLSPDIRDQLDGKLGADKGAAELVGKRIGELCLEKNISKVSFDRGGNVYHGRVQALADAARAAGLGF